MECKLVLKIGDKEMEINPGSDIKLDSGGFDKVKGIMTVDTLNPEGYPIELKNVECELDLKNGTINGKYKNYDIEGSFDPDSVRWI